MARALNYGEMRDLESIADSLEMLRKKYGFTAPEEVQSRLWEFARELHDLATGLEENKQ